MTFPRRRPPAIPTCPHCGGRARWHVTGFAWHGDQATVACESYALRLERLWGPILVRGL